MIFIRKMPKLFKNNLQNEERRRNWTTLADIRLLYHLAIRQNVKKMKKNVLKWFFAADLNVRVVFYNLKRCFQAHSKIFNQNTWAPSAFVILSPHTLHILPPLFWILPNYIVQKFIGGSFGAYFVCMVVKSEGKCAVSLLEFPPLIFIFPDPLGQKLLIVSLRIAWINLISIGRSLIHCIALTKVRNDQNASLLLTKFLHEGQWLSTLRPVFCVAHMPRSRLRVCWRLWWPPGLSIIFLSDSICCIFKWLVARWLSAHRPSTAQITSVVTYIVGGLWSYLIFHMCLWSFHSFEQNELQIWWIFIYFSHLNGISVCIQVYIATVAW